MKINLPNIKFFFILTMGLFCYSCEFIIHRMNNPRPFANISLASNEIESINPQTELQFIVIGDWGEMGKFSQLQVATAMQKIASIEKIDFILTTGDNFYESGVKDLRDLHFKKSYENIYPFLKNIPWFITLGNHDYMGDIQTLIDYGKINSNWILPSPYYSFKKKVSASETALFLLTDTNEFIHILHLFYYRTYMKYENGRIQLGWMNTILQNNTPKWKIVVGHHPIYSAGEHGDTTTLHGKFLENLEKNHVDIYLAGHDHDLQYLKHPNKKIHFFISGSGSKFREMRSNPYSVFAAPEPGFLIIRLNAKEAIIRFINQKAEEIYKTTIQK